MKKLCWARLVRCTECEISSSESNGSYLAKDDRVDDDDDNADAEDVLNTPIIIQHPEDPLSFMYALDIQAMHVPEFLEYANMVSDYVANGELCIGMEFNDKETIIWVIKNNNISKSVDYNMYELEIKTFYYKYKYYSLGCNWLIRVSLRMKKDISEMRKYNDRHTCTVTMISQDHTKLDVDIITQLIEPMVWSDTCIKVKLVIGEIQSQYGYTRTYRKAWMAKEKEIVRVYGG